MEAIADLVNWKHILIQLGLFLFVVFFLTHLVFKPVMNLLSEREKRIFGDREEARDLVKRAEDRVKVYEEKIYKAKSEAKDMKIKIINEAGQKEREILSLAREDSSRIISQMRDRMLEEASALKPRLNSEAESLAKEMAEIVLGRRV